MLGNINSNVISKKSLKFSAGYTMNKRNYMLTIPVSCPAANKLRLGCDVITQNLS